MRTRLPWLVLLALVFSVLLNAGPGVGSASPGPDLLCFDAAAPEPATPPSTGSEFVQLLPTGGPQAGRTDLVYAYGSSNDVPVGPSELRWVPGHTWSWKICYPVSPAKYDAVASFIRDQVTTLHQYRLFSSNCAEWTQHVARIANVDLPAQGPTGAGRLPIPDPANLAERLGAIGAGGTFGGGTIYENPRPGAAPEGAGVAAAIPDQCSYSGIGAAAFRDPRGLAGELSRQVHDLRLAPEPVGIAQPLTVDLGDVTPTESLIAVDFGDGTVVEQRASIAHAYALPGSFTVRIVVVSPQAVDRFSFVARVSAVGRPATRVIAVPTDPPPVPFPAAETVYCPESLEGPPVCSPPATANPDEYSYVNTHYYHAISNEAALPDERYFGETGFRVDNDAIWGYFNAHGGLDTLGYPISRTFTFRGSTVQFFQRQVVELDSQGRPHLLGLLDPGMLGLYSRVNGATLPGVDAKLISGAPNSANTPEALAFVAAHAPDWFQGMPVNFGQSFLRTAMVPVSFPLVRFATRSPGSDLAVWGMPTSDPMVDPGNHRFAYLRFQRGIMQYDAGCGCTRGVLLGDYLKGIITGEGLPDDLRREAEGSPYYGQYDPTQLQWVRDPGRLPQTDLTNAFVAEIRPAPASPDPTADAGDASPGAAILDTTILVFRQSLEAILVLAAITAGLAGKRGAYTKPIGMGVAAGLLATAVTWFVVVRLISWIGAPSVDVQAATEVMAVILLLIVMNWFFHKIYWTGWISRNARKQRQLVEAASRSGSATILGLALLGFVSVYREGFEVVLLLQNLRVAAGPEPVLDGVLVGLGLSAVVAWFTFVAREHLPYKKMLVGTGILLGFVLLVMVGGAVRDGQEANWVSITQVPLAVPRSITVWASVFPTAEGLAAQAIAAAVVIGSYVAASYARARRGRARLSVDVPAEVMLGR